LKTAKVRKEITLILQDFGSSYLTVRLRNVVYEEERRKKNTTSRTEFPAVSGTSHDSRLGTEQEITQAAHVDLSPRDKVNRTG
jgi:hypothetical protein